MTIKRRYDEKVLALWEKANSMNEIALRLGIHRQTVSNILEHYDIIKFVGVKPVRCLVCKRFKRPHTYHDHEHS